MSYRPDPIVMAQRMRRVAPTLPDPKDRELFIQYARELEERALEHVRQH